MVCLELNPLAGASLNGPQYGEVWSGAVCSGIVSRSIRDAAAYIDLVSGELKGDPYTIPAPAVPYTEEIKRAPRNL